MGLGAQLEDAGALLTDAARGADDGLQGEARTQRRDVGHAADRDGVHGDDPLDGAEIQTAFDGGDRPHVLAGGEDGAGIAAHTERQHAVGAHAGRVIIREGANVRVTRAAEIVEDEAGQGVVAEQVQVGGAVEGDDVRRGDLTGEDVGGRALVDGRAVEDQAVGGGRDDHAGGGSEQVDRTAVDHGAAGVAGGGVGQVDVAAAGGEHEAHGRSGRIVHDAGIQRERVRAIEEIEVADP